MPTAYVVSEDVKGVKWESFIPPTAKVKATMDAKFNEAGELVVAPDAKISAGAFKGTAPDGTFGTIRGRALKNLPITEDFEGYTSPKSSPSIPEQPSLQVRLSAAPMDRCALQIPGHGKRRQQGLRQEL
jgi:hypothetical protein